MKSVSLYSTYKLIFSPVIVHAGFSVSFFSLSMNKFFRAFIPSISVMSNVLPDEFILIADENKFKAKVNIFFSNN